jgi:hypothetical protein
MQSPSARFGLLFFSITKLADYDSFVEVLLRKRIATLETADAYSEELFRFLYIKAHYLYVSPSPIVDQCWHCLLLLPLLYKRVCTILLSAQNARQYEEGIITHDPLGGDNQFARNKRYETAQSHYAFMFPEGPAAAGVWPKKYHERTPERNSPMKRKRDVIEDVNNTEVHVLPLDSEGHTGVDQVIPQIQWQPSTVLKLSIPSEVCLKLPILQVLKQ